jgi:osmotically-inducible protein OsmY
VHNALKWDDNVPETGIMSTVSRGWVTLEGTVDYYSQRFEAERALLRLSGVSGVTNNIDVVEREVSSDALRDAIREALARSAERESRGIEVALHEGIVTLTGTVDSGRDKRAVLDAVAHADGVRAIEDGLRVGPAT